MDTEVVVVGSGVAGCVCAYTLAKAGIETVLLTKNSEVAESNTLYAQGGIIYKGLNDSPDKLSSDIMKAGADISNPEAVDIVSRQGSQLVEDILIRDFGVKFSRDALGELDLTEEGAHSERRIIHTADATGRSIEEAAVAALSRTAKLQVLNDHTAVDIITWDHHSTDKLRMYRPLTALGVYALHNGTRRVERIMSKAVVIATGGMGRIYLHTTNPESSTGDGYAMAARAGARLANMEYTQFHPTTLYHPKASNFLISEAVRGEGAVILDSLGRAFMEKYHPQKDLAPRDIVTRAILSEMLESGEKFVFLDAARIGADKVRTRFPNISRRCGEFGFDITAEPIPIVPAFHFQCGGIWTDMNARTTIERLYACGEVACTGLHGGNRLASTSLLEGLVYGFRAASDIIERRHDLSTRAHPDVPEWIDTGIIETVDPALINQDWNSLQNIMWNYVGAVRNRKRLRRAIIDLQNLREDIENFYRDAKMHRTVIELRNAVQTGLLVAQHALSNRESIGAHYRID